ncbi:M10 family metallopeptidase C-terminal domain-containing protein, partial [Inquilinus limosus]|uniref:calcium-binding protein n=1 Tax=Inquilinus limosus TaxID=171674 RepID=UPI003F1429BB
MSDINGTDSGETIIGTNSNDTIDGHGGNDTIIGGDGSDILTGGAGNDVFAYNSRGFDADTITDFNTNGDRIDLAYLHVSDFGSLQPFMRQDGDDVVIDLGFYNSDDEFIRLENVTIGSLSASDFVFDTSGTALT